MKLQGNNQLNKAFAMLGISDALLEQLRQQVVAHMLKNGYLTDTDENYGYPIDSCLEDEGAVALNSLKQTAKPFVRFLFKNLIVMGDGDCPECGGEMERTDVERRTIGVDGFIDPFEYKDVWEECTCRSCGFRSSNEP